VRSLLVTAAVCAVLTGLCIVTIDQPFARWIATRETYPAFWNTVIAYLEYPLGITPYKWAGVDVLVGASLVTLVVPRLRSHAHLWLLLALSHLLGRNIMFWGKTLTGRLRPSEWVARGGDTFWRDGGYSFPSGHVILFASVVLPIVVAYPRARPLLFVVAFAMVARVAVNAHFLSDVLGGLAVSLAVTWLCVRALRRALPSQIRPPYLQ
jgi:undecaprenyl-diphosphatase